ncbi:hypothetical protein [Aldersonia kunmingensis]|uniref:hypothetical protein n=1 Tax=Aldersonia kunmingensis TaxID=408066 RepID=UPI0012EE1F48|nr:hypothetical protein [Aldersonia kunmingensis]
MSGTNPEVFDTTIVWLIDGTSREAVLRQHVDEACDVANHHAAVGRRHQVAQVRMFSQRRPKRMAPRSYGAPPVRVGREVEIDGGKGSRVRPQ